jgi:hypothetical protein
MDQDCLQSLSGFSGANQEGMRQRFFPNRIRPRLTDPEYNVKGRTIKITWRAESSDISHRWLTEETAGIRD